VFPWNAFPRGPLVCDYIGVINVLYVNDMNRLSREDQSREDQSRARINFERVHSESTCPSRTRGNAAA